MTFIVVLALHTLGASLHTPRASIAPPQPTDDPEIHLAVLSPGGNPVLDRIGELHDASARAAIQLEGALLSGDESMSRLTLHHLRGGPDPSTCQQSARRAVETFGAVALLGPVTSGCTRAVLRADLDVPVVTSLSTASRLDTVGGEWLFRTIAHDRRRISTYVRTVRPRDDGTRIEGGFALYENSVYGRGLRNHVIEQASIEEDHTHRWDRIIDHEASRHGEIIFTEEFRRMLTQHGHQIPTVFVLGTGRAAAITRAVADVLDPTGQSPNFVLVGSSDAEELPDRTHIIGEPRVGTSENLLSGIDRTLISESHYVSTLDAGLVVRQAIGRVLATDTVEPDRAAFRKALRRELSEGSFESSERYRTIQFDGGEVRDPPRTPIFELSLHRVQTTMNPDETKPWVEIRIVSQPAHHLEGPLVAELIPHGAELAGTQVTLSALRPSGETVPLVEQVALQREGTLVSFVPSFWTNPFPGSLRLTTNLTPPGESVRTAEFGWPFSYPLAAAFALVGAVLFTRYRARNEGDPRSSWWKAGKVRSYGERCVAGLVIAFLILHVGPLLDPPQIESASLLSKIPIPRFHSSWWMNAALSGLLGGWVGLKVIVGFVAGLIGSIAPLFQQGDG